MLAWRKILAVVLIGLTSLPALASQRAFADGLFMENLPPAAIGERDASLFVRINPPVLTTQTQEDAFLQFRLFDARNNETIKFTTFVIEITKGTDPDADPLLRDVFHTENGLLTLRIQPKEGEVSVAATREDFLKAWKADPGGTINISGPILLEGGLYRFKVDVLTVDNIRNLFAPGEEPSYETYLSVGDVYTTEVQSNGNAYPTTIISYYDKVQDFMFDPATVAFSWSMPFDWNVERISSVNSIFVHEEIKVPKSFAGVGDSMAFEAEINGRPIPGRMLSIDPFTSEQDLIIHILANRNDLVEIAQNLPDNTTTMDFQFSPASNGGEQTSGEIVTDTGGISVLMDWTPDQLAAGNEATLELKFFDAFSGNKITRDVKYDLRVYDTDGTEVYSLVDQTASGGSDSQTMTFPADKNYRVEVKVNAIMADGQTPDLTRNGTARGTVVVPEFPAGALIAAAGVIGSILAFQRLTRKT